MSKFRFSLQARFAQIWSASRLWMFSADMPRFASRLPTSLTELDRRFADSRPLPNRRRYI